jgi:hypothetical protein
MLTEHPHRHRPADHEVAPMTEPLSPEEEAVLRRGAWATSAWPEVMPRIWATLDAARARLKFRSLVNLDAAHGSIFAAAPTPAIDRRWIAEADRFLTAGSGFNGHSGPDLIAAHIALDSALRGAPFVDANADRLDPSEPCTCGHRRDHHINRDVDDVVGWPCLACRSKRCRGFAALDASPAPREETTE